MAVRGLSSTMCCESSERPSTSLCPLSSSTSRLGLWETMNQSKNAGEEDVLVAQRAELSLDIIINPGKLS